MEKKKTHLEEIKDKISSLKLQISEVRKENEAIRAKKLDILGQIEKNKHVQEEIMIVDSAELRSWKGIILFV
jgi:hypothetical protein